MGWPSRTVTVVGVIVNESEPASTPVSRSIAPSPSSSQPHGWSPPSAVHVYDVPSSGLGSNVYENSRESPTACEPGRHWPSHDTSVTVPVTAYVPVIDA